MQSTDYSHLGLDGVAIFRHVRAAAAAQPGSEERRQSLFAAGVRLMRAEDELRAAAYVVTLLEAEDKAHAESVQQG